MSLRERFRTWFNRPGGGAVENVWIALAIVVIALFLAALVGLLQ